MMIILNFIIIIFIIILSIYLFIEYYIISILKKYKIKELYISTSLLEESYLLDKIIINGKKIENINIKKDIHNLFFYLWNNPKLASKYVHVSIKRDNRYKKFNIKIYRIIWKSVIYIKF